MRDPYAPRKALSAFIFFSQSERDNVKKNNPGISLTDVGRALGDRWREMTAEEKEPYEAKAQADQVRYREARNTVFGSMFFSQRERTNVMKCSSGISFTDVARTLGERLRTMTIEEKKPYQAKAWKKTPTEPFYVTKWKVKNGEKEGSKNKKDPTAPKKPVCGFMCFSQSEGGNVTKSNPGITFTDVGRALGDRWRKMTAEEKEPYEAKARADQVSFK